MPNRSVVSSPEILKTLTNFFPTYKNEEWVSNKKEILKLVENANLSRNSLYSHIITGNTYYTSRLPDVSYDNPFKVWMAYIDEIRGFLDVKYFGPGKNPNAKLVSDPNNLYDITNPASYKDHGYVAL